MKIILLVTSLLAAALGLSPSLNCALKNQVVIDFKNAVIPVVYKKIHHIDMPDIHTSKAGFKITVSHIHVDINPISGNNIGIKFIPNSSKIEISAHKLGMKGGAHIKAKWHFISKSFNAHVSISDLSFNVKTTLISHGGKPNIKIDSLHIGLSSHHVKIKFSGGILSKILEFVANLLKGHFVKNIVHGLEKSMPNQITTQVNKVLNSLPSDINIGHSLAVKYAYPVASHVKNGYLFTGISAYVHRQGHPNPPPFNPPHIPEYNAQDNRGIQFFFSDYIIKSAIHAGFELGLYKISFEKKIENHNVKMTCKATKEPALSFKNAIDVQLFATCDVLVDNKADEAFWLMTELHVNLKEYIKQAILFFSISTFKIEKAEYKFRKTIKIEWFKKSLNEVFATIKEIVNHEIGNKGIPLPTVKGVDYHDIVQYVKTGYIEIGVNPKFHLTAVDEEEDQTK